ncbi:MAG: hypothetical protein C4525_03085 [Desulfarculus sp.]|jgi:hypothetical protein|nr:MAG: hypothetical protein C4525_03085 [Desulfarculus sp.]
MAYLVLEPGKFDEVAAKLSRVAGGLAKVLESGLHRTSKGMATDTARAGREIYNIKHGQIIRDLRKIFPKIARGDFSTGVDIARKARRLSLMGYSPRPSKPVSKGGTRPRQGPTVLIRKDRGRKAVKGAFIASPKTADGTEPSGYVMFKRKGKARTPIKKLTGPGVISILKREQVRQRVSGNALERLHKQLDYGTERLLQRAGLA